jgi:hypothetical protein
LRLASLGRAEALPVLTRLLDDPNGFVRSYVRIGVERALKAGRCSDEFRRVMYETLLNQCDQVWSGTSNKAAEIVVALDPERAAIDFPSVRWLSVDNRNTFRILDACNEANIELPEDLLRRLLENSLPLAVGEKCYPHQYIVAAALEALAMTAASQVKPLLESLLASDQEKKQVSAAKGLATLAGLRDPIQFVLQLVEQVGF